MVFITFYDLRHAELAKRELQDTDIHGRKIDVHWSVPKEDESKEEDRNKGTIMVIVKDPTELPDTLELRTLFEQWGDIKEVRDTYGNPNQKFVECWDTRDSAKIVENYQGFPFAGGKIEMKYALNTTSHREKRALGTVGGGGGVRSGGAISRNVRSDGSNSGYHSGPPPNYSRSNNITSSNTQSYNNNNNNNNNNNDAYNPNPTLNLLSNPALAATPQQQQAALLQLLLLSNPSLATAATTAPTTNTQDPTLQAAQLAYLLQFAQMSQPVLPTTTNPLLSMTGQPTGIPSYTPTSNQVNTPNQQPPRDSYYG
eukprot:TRINITY_DN2095_c0_g1_i2.p1 TRINITY_DN2095_c0_g1~~TRINITY_DN2095_c0_g1_i2.p1  ORF type:complete len:312 (-),score=71.67 TRINITY_DN2095_c0_g1_i2:68-1003(-)